MISPTDLARVEQAFPDRPPPYSERPLRDRLTRSARLARWGYPTLLRVSGRRKSYAASRRVDLLIDGCPRSANTFATVQVVLLNPGISVAHHAHAVSQFTAAERLDLPALLLVRDPIEAVASVRAGWPHWSAGASASEDLSYWVDFHERIMRWAPRAVAIRTSELQVDLAAAQRLPQFSGFQLASPDLGDDEVSDVVVKIERQRGDRGSVDRSSSRSVLSQRRSSAVSALLSELHEDEIAGARECYQRVVAALGVGR